MHRLLLATLLLAAGCASTPRQGATDKAGTPPAAKRPSFLGPKEILERLEASTVQYVFEDKDTPPGGWAEQLWPERVRPVPRPRGVVEGDTRRVVSAPTHAEAEQLLKEAEPHFQAKRYDKAAELYERATAVCPECIDGWIFRGDAALFSGEPAAALALYEKAATLGPHDYRPYFFQGHALARLGRPAQAREALATALVLNPRITTLRQFIKKNPGFGLTVTPDVVVPRGFAFRDGDVVRVHYDPHYSPGWLAFASCKALWLGEPSHREEMTGSTSDSLHSSTEELECLGAALAAHLATRDEEEDREDAGLERLHQIAEDGMAGELVLFELTSRIHPQATLLLDDSSSPASGSGVKEPRSG
jgi:hypothetical protein